MSVLFSLFSPWCWKMAWRDSRRSRWRLLLFSASIMAGIAALVVIGSLRQSLLDALEREARDLLGGDVYVHSQRPFPEKAETILAGIPSRVVRETALTAMAAAAERGGSRLVQARGVEPGFPLYGTVVTDPPDAWAACLDGQGFVAAPALAEALQLKTGDQVRLGQLELPLLGTLVKPPPQVSALGVIAPELFLARARLDATKLAGGNDFSFYRMWLAVPPGLDVETRVLPRVRDRLRAAGLSVETVAGRKKTISQVLEVLYSFLSLMAFIALVLGGLGVASALHVHSMERLPVVATLRCLGCPAGRAMAVYVAQGILLGLVGAAGGVLAGWAIQALAPVLLNSVLPVHVEAGLSGKLAGMALGFGFLVCVAFALLPLLPLRRVSPLAAVRAAVVQPAGGWRDPLRWVILTCLTAVLIVIARTLSPQIPGAGVGFAGALAVGLLLLALTARLIMAVARRIARPWWPFPIRQGLAGLYRPRNQTLLFLLSAGLGVSLVLSTLLVQDLLVQRFQSRALTGKANLYAIDVKPDERGAVQAKMQELRAPVVDFAPIVLTTLLEVNGVRPAALQKKPREDRPSRRVLNAVYRSTWRSELGDGETLTEGESVARWSAADGPVPITVEENLAREWKVEAGDTVKLNAGMKPLECRIAGVRKVEWQEMRLNFLIVFPDGVFTDNDATWALSARLSTPADSARVQRELTAAFPSLTVFDISAIVSTVEDIVDKAAWVVRGMSLLTVLTGILIIIAVLLAGRRDRLEESVLLRTLGASRSQIRQILASEYLLLGFFSALTGAVLSLGFAWALAKFVFKLPFTAWLSPLGAAIVIVCALTGGLGWLLSRGITRHPPLAILRQEG